KRRVASIAEAALRGTARTGPEERREGWSGLPSGSPGASGRRALDGDRGVEGLADVGQDVVDVLDADREAQVARSHARGELVLGAQLLVRRACRVDCQGARVAD